MFRLTDEQLRQMEFTPTYAESWKHLYWHDKVNFIFGAVILGFGFGTLVTTPFVSTSVGTDIIINALLMMVFFFFYTNLGKIGVLRQRLIEATETVNILSDPDTMNAISEADRELKSRKMVK